MFVYLRYYFFEFLFRCCFFVITQQRWLLLPKVVLLWCKHLCIYELEAFIFIIKYYNGDHDPFPRAGIGESINKSGCYAGIDEGRIVPAGAA